MYIFIDKSCIKPSRTLYKHRLNANTQLFAKEKTTSSLHLSQQKTQHKVKRPILWRTKAWLADPNFYAAIVQRGHPPYNDKEAIFFLSPINDNSPSINTTTCSSFQNNRPNCHVWFIAKTTKHIPHFLSLFSAEQCWINACPLHSKRREEIKQN